MQSSMSASVLRVILVDAQHAGALLLELRTSGATIPELPDGLRPGSWQEAYAIQDALHAAAGWEIGVLKVGCTGAPAQEALGVAEPIGGRIPTAAVFESGSVLPSAEFHHEPLLESEFAFRIRHDVAPGHPISGLDAVGDLIDFVAPAIEVVDSRYNEMFGASGPSIVADNSAAAAVVLGPAVAVDSAGELADCAVELRQGSDVLAHGSGAAVLGHPVKALEWVLGHESRRGRLVAAGTWVITGTCTGLVPAPLGQTVTAHFDGLGEVGLTLQA